MLKKNPFYQIKTFQIKLCVRLQPCWLHYPGELVSLWAHLHWHSTEVMVLEKHRATESHGYYCSAQIKRTTSSLSLQMGKGKWKNILGFIKEASFFFPLPVFLLHCFHHCLRWGVQTVLRSLIKLRTKRMLEGCWRKVRGKGEVKWNPSTPQVREAHLDEVWSWSVKKPGMLKPQPDERENFHRRPCPLTKTPSVHRRN